MEMLLPTQCRTLPRRGHYSLQKMLSFSFFCLFLSLPTGITTHAQEVHPDGIGVCSGVVRKIDSFTISYIQSRLVRYSGVCSWLDMQGCDQYKIVFTPAYKKVFRTMYHQAYSCCRGFIREGRSCVEVTNPKPTTKPFNRPRPPQRPPQPDPIPPKPQPRPPLIPRPPPSHPARPSPGEGEWGDLPVIGNDGATPGKPGSGGQGNGDGPTPLPTQRPAADAATEYPRRPTRNSTGTLRLLMVIGIMLSVIGISVACSLCMMCWNHTRRDHRRPSQSYAYVSKGKDDSTVTISTISRGYSMESFNSSVSSASEASTSRDLVPEPLIKAHTHAFEEGDSGIGKGSLYSDESTSLVSDGTNSLEKNEQPPRFGYSKGSGFARRIAASAGTYSCTYLAGKSKKQDREQLTPSPKEPWTEIRPVGSTKETCSVYQTLEPEMFEEEDNSSTSDDVSCGDSVSVGTTSDKPKAYAYAKVKLDHNTGMLYGSDPRYGVFPVQSWDRPGSTEYGSLASSTMTLHSNNGYDRLDRNCRKHQQGDSVKLKKCRHRDFEQQLVKLKPPPPPPVCPKPRQEKPPPILPQMQFHPARVAPPPPVGRRSLGVQRDSGSSGVSSCPNDMSMRQSVASERSDTTLTPPVSPNRQLLNANQDFKRLLGGSLGNISVRSEGGQLYSNTKPSYTKVVGGSWNNISTTNTETSKPKLQKSRAISTEEPSYSIICKERSSITRETVTEITNKLNSLKTPAIFVQNSNDSLNTIEPPYTTVMRVSSATDVSSISDGKLTPPLHNMRSDWMYSTGGSMSDISIASNDLYASSSTRNTGDFSDIDLSTPRNTQDFSDIELVNLSSDSLKMDTRYSIASGTYTYT